MPACQKVHLKSAANLYFAVFFSALLVVAACSSPTATDPAPASPTTRSTIISSPSPVPQTTKTPLRESTRPAASPTATGPVNTPEPTPTEGCTNDATFLNDITVPDNSIFAPGDSIDKRWSIQNTGTCDWRADYRFVLTSGDGMGAAPETALFPARSGTVATIQVPMTAPAEPGDYISRWQARSPEGNLFGAVVFIKIKVVGPEQPTAIPLP